MKIILFVNEKGGVGKTSLCLNTAFALAERGHRVLVVDGDPQGHSTLRTRHNKAGGLYDLLVRDAEWSQVCKVVAPEIYGVPGYPVPRARLALVPGNIETRNIANTISETKALSYRLEELHGDFDCVLIDTSPTPSLLHAVFYDAADTIIFPTELAFMSFDGLIESIQHKLAADKYRVSTDNRKPINIGGIVPVKYRRITIEERTNLDRLRGEFGDLVWKPIPLATVWQQSEGDKCAVFTTDPRSSAAQHVWQLSERIEGVLHG